jgi:SM-20-related protein
MTAAIVTAAGSKVAAKTTMAAETAPQHRSADARCPHIVFRDVLGPDIVDGLLGHVAAREADFKPAVVRNRTSGQRRVDYGLRSAVSITDLAAFKAPFKNYVEKITASALAQLHLPEPAVEPKEFEINAYRDGGHFGAHIGTNEQVARVRVVSCVYYFAATPRRFSGGELRIFSLPTLSAGKDGGSQPFVDIVPESDTLVVFPSWLRHEVLPVRVPSGAWIDGRFTVNCWLHRVNPSPNATSVGA